MCFSERIKFVATYCLALAFLTIVAADQEYVLAQDQGLTMSLTVVEALEEAQSQANSGEYDKAIQGLTALLNTLSPNELEASNIHNLLGYLHYSNGEYPKALESYLTVFHSAHTADSASSIAQISFAMKNYEQAAAFGIEWKNRIASPSPMPHILIGQSYYSLKQFVDAILYMEDAIKIAQEQESSVDENWVLVLRSLYYETQDYARTYAVQRVLAE